ncbi:HlyD family efflux transporter periplasmic adaptor subunit [Desulfococcaceae bacterium OttesenSCG-928-F15]|nr:HlyD family efflux transporter periplasmic adaptor subunit [Desulfococcaceae bacterium OttesenSCG-928-F15]
MGSLKKLVNWSKSDAFNVNDEELKRSSLFIWAIILMFAAFGFWASKFKLDEVSTGMGKVVASSKEQDIQSLDGGVLLKTLVREGQIVEAGETVAKLDPVRILSSVKENNAKLRANLAHSARLQAEVSDTELVFPEEVKEDPELIRMETALYKSRREALDKALAGLERSKKLVKQELYLTRQAVAKGAASRVDVIRLETRLNELESRTNQEKDQYSVKAREELAAVNATIESQKQITLSREDALKRTTLYSPVRGIIKQVHISTEGGVVPPNGIIMTITPIDDQLEIEAQISPRDIGYIKPGLAAIVKITSYDYSLFGGLNGEVVKISPDTIQDEVRRDMYYYRVYIRTETDYLTNKQGKKFYISPGMVATVDIHTGEKTILQYLIKPVNKMREALRER